MCKLLEPSVPKKKYGGGLGGINKSTKDLLNVLWFESVRTCAGRVFQIRVVEGMYDLW